MRIISWNCQGGLIGEEKLLFFNSLNADIAILQEVRRTHLLNCPEKYWLTNQDPETNPKGLGIYVLNENYKVEILDAFTDFEIFQPIIIQAESFTINVLAVWAFNHRSRGKYSGNRDMIFDSMDYYLNLKTSFDLIIGDFNNGPEIRNGKSWLPLVDKLSDYGFTEIKFPGEKFTHTQRGEKLPD